jgi:hypothetical protein
MATASFWVIVSVVALLGVGLVVGLWGLLRPAAKDKEKHGLRN